MHHNDIVSVAAHLRYTTLIELPAEEQIIAENCGDKGFWSIDDNGRNLVFVKPLGDKPGRDTDLYITTAGGNTYGILLKEVSGDLKAKSDIKVTIQQGDEDSIVAMRDNRKNLADRVAALEGQIQQQRDTASKQAPPPKPALIHDYTWKHDKVAKHFGLTDIGHDEKATYIHASSQDAPVLYESKNGKPSLIQYTLRDGVFTIPKVLDAGYLQAGKSKVEFKREVGSGS